MAAADAHVVSTVWYLQYGVAARAPAQKKLGIPADFIPHHKLCFVALAVCVGRPAL